MKININCFFISRSVFLEWDMFQAIVVKEIKTHVLSSMLPARRRCDVGRFLEVLWPFCTLLPGGWKTLPRGLCGFMQCSNVCLVLYLCFNTIVRKIRFGLCLYYCSSSKSTWYINFLNAEYCLLLSVCLFAGQLSVLEPVSLKLSLCVFSHPAS
jgi:hypothetical protein